MDPPYYTLATFNQLWNSIYATRFDSFRHTRRESITENYLNRPVQLSHGNHGELLVAFRINFFGAEHRRATIRFTENDGATLPAFTLDRVPLQSKREEWVSMKYPIPTDMLLGLNMGFHIEGESIGRIEVEFLFIRVADISKDLASTAWGLLDASGSLAFFGDWRKGVGSSLLSREDLLAAEPPLFPSADEQGSNTPFTLPVKFLPPLSFLFSPSTRDTWDHPETSLTIKSLKDLLDPPVLSDL